MTATTIENVSFLFSNGVRKARRRIIATYQKATPGLLLIATDISFLRISINVALLVVTKSGVRKRMRRGKHSSDIHIGRTSQLSIITLRCLRLSQVAKPRRGTKLRGNYRFALLCRLCASLSAPCEQLSAPSMEPICATAPQFLLCSFSF